MSNREFAKNLIDQIPESKLFYVVSYLRGVIAPDETPNATTIAAMQELENGGGELWTGSTIDFFAALDAEEETNA